MGGSHHPVPPTTQDRQKCGTRALRQAAELTQVEFARRMGVTQAAVSRMEQPATWSCPPLTPAWRPSGVSAALITKPMSLVTSFLPRRATAWRDRRPLQRLPTILGLAPIHSAYRQGRARP